MKTKISALIWLISIIILSGTVGIAKADPVVNVHLSLLGSGQPSVGSTFCVEMTIVGPSGSSAIEVYAWTVRLRCKPPYGQQVIPLKATEGPFLPSTGDPTIFVYSIDPLIGDIRMGNMLLTPQCTGGASCGGPQTLAEVHFLCTAPGNDASIEFVECEFLDCNLDPIECKCHDLTSLNQKP